MWFLGYWCFGYCVLGFNFIKCFNNIRWEVEEIYILRIKMFWFFIELWNNKNSDIVFIIGNEILVFLDFFI